MKGENMTAKEYLGQISVLKRKVAQKKEQNKQLRNEFIYLKGINTSEKVSSSPKTDGLENAVIRIVDMEQDTANTIIEMEEKINEIINKIHELNNPDQIECLYLRYVVGENFENIAVNLHLSYHRTCHIHGEALKEFSARFIQDSN